jgi:hypothetical protein
LRFHAQDSSSDSGDILSSSATSILDIQATRITQAQAKLMSVSVDEAADITGLPVLYLRQAWSKACELLNEGSDVTAPCSSTKARMVGSKSMNKAHFVSTSKSDEFLFECDS